MFGFYKPLLDDILYLFDTTDIFKDLPNYVELQRNAQRLSTEMDQVYNRFIHLLKAKGISELVSYLQSNNVPQSYIDKTLEWLNNPTNDISIFINWFGMASNSNSMVTQAIAKMLNDTNELDIERKLWLKVLNQLNQHKQLKKNMVCRRIETIIRETQ